MEESEETETPAVQETEESKPNFLERFWYVFIILAVLVLVGLGGFWFLNRRLMRPESIPTPVVETETPSLEEQGTSDEISAIEADLEATDFSDLDQELSDIETELSSP